MEIKIQVQQICSVSKHGWQRRPLYTLTYKLRLKGTRFLIRHFPLLQLPTVSELKEMYRNHKVMNNAVWKKPRIDFKMSNSDVFTKHFDTMTERNKWWKQHVEPLNLL